MTARDDAPIAAEAGPAPPPSSGGFESFAALMELVESLCPTWPARERITTGVFKL